jgi:hypothetical protein
MPITDLTHFRFTMAEKGLSLLRNILYFLFYLTYLTHTSFNYSLMTTQKKYYTYILLVFIIILSGCESDYNLTIPDYGRRIIINGFLSTEDTISVQISESKFILDPLNYYKPLKNPTVQLWIDNQYTEDLQCRYSFSPLSQYKIDSITYLSRYKPLAGSTYSIKVIYPGFPEASATVKMPGLVPIDRIDTVLMANHFDKQYSLTFKDSEVETNYFFIKFFLTRLRLGASCDTTIFKSEWDFKPEFLYNEKFIFSDKQFNGKAAQVSYIIPSLVQDITFNFSSIGHDCSNTNINKTAYRKMYVKLYSCSEEFYLYYKSVRTTIERGDDVFYEPVKVYSNVKNGYGILAGYTVYIDSSQYVKLWSKTIPI